MVEDMGGSFIDKLESVESSTIPSIPVWVTESYTSHSLPVTQYKFY